MHLKRVCLYPYLASLNYKGNTINNLEDPIFYSYSLASSLKSLTS